MKAIVTFELYEELLESFDSSPYTSLGDFLSDFDVVRGVEGQLGARQLRMMATLARLGGAGVCIDYAILREHFLEPDREAGYSETAFWGDIDYLSRLTLIYSYGDKLHPSNGFDLPAAGLGLEQGQVQDLGSPLALLPAPAIFGFDSPVLTHDSWDQTQGLPFAGTPLLPDPPPLPLT